ncbi:RacP protein [Streptomyces venezuelae]|uniref:RacP protein n=1 Tax=Streptomyces venezuelae TaxID=54571 RepID=UPI0034318DDE
MARRSRHRGEAAEGHAEAIHKTLLEARPAGVEMPQLMRSTERNRSQIRTGLAMLRDAIAKKGRLPLRYSRADAYQYTSDPVELQEYEVRVVRQILTLIRRLITGTVISHAVLYPEDRWVRHLVAQLKAVETILDNIAPQNGS